MAKYSGRLTADDVREHLLETLDLVTGRGEGESELSAEEMAKELLKIRMVCISCLATIVALGDIYTKGNDVLVSKALDNVIRDLRSTSNQYVKILHNRRGERSKGLHS